MDFSRQEYWSGLPFPSPGDLPDPGIQPGSPALQADSLLSELPGKPPKTHVYLTLNFICFSLCHDAHASRFIIYLGYKIGIYIESENITILKLGVFFDILYFSPLLNTE